MTLTLPLPPSPNDVPSHHMAAHHAKNAYRAKAWIEAVSQFPPKHVDELPAKVRVEAILYVHSLRDEDNAHFSSCKWPLDALKAVQRGKLKWRNGLHTAKGYLVDDSPKHCEVTKPVQKIDRRNPRMVLTITPIGD